MTYEEYLENRIQCAEKGAKFHNDLATFWSDQLQYAYNEDIEFRVKEAQARELSKAKKCFNEAKGFRATLALIAQK